MSDNSLLQRGIEAARRGDQATARRLLEQVVNQDPNSELGWMWLASVVTTVRERRICLERVLRINPDNQRARQALTQLGGTPPAPRRQPAGGADNPAARIDPINIVLVVVAAVAIIAILLVIPRVEDLLTPDPTPTRIPTRFIPPTAVVLPPPPTRVPNPFSGTSGAPPLPPTFTPTPTSTPTASPTPSATPYPLENFTILYTSLAEGDTQPALYEMRADGSGSRFLLANVREAVYDPTGQQIALIREVEYQIDITDEAGVTQPVTRLLPELFIADINDLENARQITQMRTNLVERPTWSPDGREIVFVSDFEGNQDLWYITPDGGTLNNITDSEFTERDPAWEPRQGSRRLLFASDQDSFGSTEIYSITLPVAGSGDVPVITQITNDNRSSYHPMWSLNGSLVVFLSDRGSDADLYTMNPDGSRQTLITRDDNRAEDRSPFFSPDRRFIGFISNRLDDRFQVYLIATAGDTLIRLTENEQQDLALAFRPEVLFRLAR